MSLSIKQVAHRGGAALAPENTLAAFRNALHFHVDAIELDVQMTRDGQPVVFHDDTLERLTDGQGEIVLHDLAYLRSLHAAAHFAGGWPEVQRIPTLPEVLDLARESGVQVLIEIKSQHLGGSYRAHPESVLEVARAVRQCGMEERVLVMSFDWGVLEPCQMLMPEVQRGALVSSSQWDPGTSANLSTLLARVQALGVAWVNMDARLFTPDMPALMHSEGLQLGLWTVNDPDRLRQFAVAGVDSLTSDRPDLFPAFPI